MPQRPDWFVAHWWGDSVRHFQTSLSAHHRDRRLDEKTTAYWIAAYARNQWTLEPSLGSDPDGSPFRRALECAGGLVCVVDRELNCLKRTWVCFEISTGLQLAEARNVEEHGEAGFKFDIYTVLPTGNATGINDGHVVIDGGDDAIREDREALFPTSAIAALLQMEVQEGSSTLEDDHVRLLNFLADRPRADAPLRMHWSYNVFNSLVRARLLPRLMRTALFRGGLSFQCLMSALASARLRRYEDTFVQVTSNGKREGVSGFTKDACYEILTHLTSGLLSLALVLPLKALPVLKTHECVQFHRLQKLSLAQSSWLQHLPDWIRELVALKKLILSECFSLRSLPDGNILEPLANIELIDLTGCTELFNAKQAGRKFGFARDASQRGVERLIEARRIEHPGMPLKILNEHGVPMDEVAQEFTQKGRQGATVAMPSSQGRSLQVTAEDTDGMEEIAVKVQCKQIHRRIEVLMREYELEPEELAAEDSYRWAIINATWCKAGEQMTSDESLPEEERICTPPHELGEHAKPAIPSTTPLASQTSASRERSRRRSHTNVNSGAAQSTQSKRSTAMPPSSAAAPHEKKVAKAGANGNRDGWQSWLSERVEQRQRMIEDLNSGSAGQPLQSVRTSGFE